MYFLLEFYELCEVINTLMVTYGFHVLLGPPETKCETL